ncbi:GGDEF and EAL domain-containing protein [Oricola sp.]|uniref:putative bifunctional diguanylate cyclase/phosphodiesterase n=1 Tax=Oricola sp. TaxID=1979950 RepID=UPI0025DE9D5A|nr:GGDEF and EAL domain-containing protein [Oricola sp.]MCI5077811.1 EAL domain-containing protein [Oricola sp.]
MTKLDEDTAGRVRAAITRAWWRPQDPVLLAMLHEKEASGNRRVIRWGMWAAVLSYIAYGFLDYFLLPDTAMSSILTRTLVGVSFLTMIEICIRTGASQQLLHLVSATAIVTGGVAWLLVAVHSVHQVALSYFMVFGITFILGSNLFFNFRFLLSFIASATITVTFCVAIMQYLQIGLPGRIALTVFFVNSLVLSLYLSWRLGLERYHTFVHSLQAKIQEKVAIENGQKLHEIANTDPLTGLRNRRAIAREFMEMRKSWASGEQQIGVILADVDYFKRFNDRLGHQAGDDCLVQLAEAFSKTADRFGALAGRHGGEEFIFLCKVRDEEHLAEISEELCDVVKRLGIEHPDRGDGLHVITISVGASISRAETSLELSALLQEADRALYSSKFIGRATFTIFDPDNNDSDFSTQNLSVLLKEAQARDLVSTVYQPIKDMETGEITGFETLMRLCDFDGSVISPNVFIPEAERTGAIVELGYWVIERAVRDISALKSDGVISVNVSGIQLKAPGFPLRVAEIIAREGLPARRLALEITEGIDIFLESQALKSVEELRSFGVQIWLDDFGTGFAGLAWLREIEFDLVKIDKGFLQDCQSENGVLMLQDMVKLLHNRGVHVLVEGVESEEQLQLLERLEVNLAQGFWIGRPSPLESYEKAAAAEPATKKPVQARAKSKARAAAQRRAAAKVG